jgi:hypothetical protein
MMNGIIDLKRSTKIEAWLRDIGCTPVPVPLEPATNWAVAVTIPPGTHMVVFNLKQAPRAVIVQARMVPLPAQSEAFGALEEDSRREFWQELRSTLNREFTEFQLEGAPYNCPAAFVVSATRWDDGLTLDSFARTLSSVNKACLDGSAVFEEHLGTGGPAAVGGEFAFKKIDVQ